MAENYTAPMPPKLSQVRSTSGGYGKAPITRAGMHTNASPMMKGAAAKNVDLQPPPTTTSVFPREQNGFDPLNGDLPPADDAQSRQTEAPPIAAETERAAVPETTAEPTSGGESDPIIEGENSATGGLQEARYPAKVPAGHPVGFPSN